MMVKLPLILAAAAGATLATGSSVLAGPAPAPGSEPKLQISVKAPPSSGTPESNFSENFDSYTVGSGIAGQNGWELWDMFALDGVITNATAASAPNSFEAVSETDVVRLFDITSGVWELKVDTYVPSSMFGEGYFIMLNTFELPFNASTARWSLQIQFNPATGVVESQWGYETTPLIMDQWVELRAEIDLDAQPDGLLNVWYNNTQFVFNRPWNGNTSQPFGGAVRIQAMDLYSPGAGFKWDNVSLTEMGGCYANCDGSTVQPVLNVDDFTCFINEFAAAQPLGHQQQLTHYANCDGSTTAPVLNVDDFTCFINAFAAGCP